MSNEVGDLIISGAYETGLLTRKSVDSLLSVTGAANKIAQGLGDAPILKDVFLVSLIVDDSGSIFEKRNNASVAQGHNSIIRELKQLSEHETATLILTWYLNGKVLNPCTTLARATLIDSSNYHDAGGTPLYDQSVTTLGTVVAKAVQLTSLGATVRTFTLIISDGADKRSQYATARSVAWIVGDMLMTGNHIVAAMGVSDGITNFRSVFREMGIKPGWIFEPKDSHDAIRKAFSEVTDQLTLGAGSRDAFTELALGPGPGFT